MRALAAIRRAITAVILAIAAASSSAAATFTGKVVGVADGDTLTVLVDGNRQVKVRLTGIDAPELG
jgi:endonuclease YncB( thermonuclease family)